MIQSEKRSKWQLFNALVAFRINGESYNSDLRTEEIVDKAKSLVERIENHGTDDLTECFVSGEEGLESMLLEKEDMPRIMSKHLVFPEDSDENYYDLEGNPNRSGSAVDK